MAQRRAVTSRLATQYKQASRSEKSEIPNQFVELTGWHRDHARVELERLTSSGVVQVGMPRSRTMRVLVVEDEKRLAASVALDRRARPADLPRMEDDPGMVRMHEL